MKFPKRFTGKITKFHKSGAGVLPRAGKRPVLVYNAIPGEGVEADAVGRAKGGLRGELVEVTTPSPDRTEPRCPYADICGGCKWQHIDYEAQTRAKLGGVRKAFNDASLPVLPERIIPSPHIFYYRNRMDYIFSWKGELGLREPGKWWSVVDLDECYLLDATTPEILRIVRAWSRDMTFWDQKRREGFLRYLVIREGKNTGERMVMILTSEDAAQEPKMMDLVAQLGDLATSVVWGVTDHRKDDAFAKSYRALKGEPWIFEEINGIRYRITPNAFFQTNTAMAEELQNVVLGYVGDATGKTVMDLYCGSGFFTLALAKQGIRAVGVELVEEAIDAAKENAARNGIKAEFHAESTEDFDWSAYAPDTVIVDPPRSGLHPKALKSLVANAPEELIYVSCNYNRFAEECEELLKAYDIAESVALDMFPHTPHVEVVTKLVRK